MNKQSIFFLNPALSFDPFAYFHIFSSLSLGGLNESSNSSKTSASGWHLPPYSMHICPTLPHGLDLDTGQIAAANDAKFSLQSAAAIHSLWIQGSICPIRNIDDVLEFGWRKVVTSTSFGCCSVSGARSFPGSHRCSGEEVWPPRRPGRRHLRCSIHSNFQLSQLCQLCTFPKPLG